MATGKKTTLTSVFLNNSTSATTVKIPVEQVVKDDKVVIDDRDLHPGVIIRGEGK